MYTKKFQIFHDFEIFGRIGIFVGDQRASERKHVTRKFWISNRISQNDYNIRTIIFIQKAIIFKNFQRIMPNKINTGRGCRTFSARTGFSESKVSHGWPVIYKFIARCKQFRLGRIRLVWNESQPALFLLNRLVLRGLPLRWCYRFIVFFNFLVMFKIWSISL